MSNPATQEGVIKYGLEFYSKAPTSPDRLTTINAWRTVLHRLRLIGQTPERYDGYGYGNISQRITNSGTPSPEDTFLISGTQTGSIETLIAAQYCTITLAEPLQNRIVAEGPIKPSSEALTHASIYQTDSHVESVMHVHSPEIWRKTEALKLQCTGKTIEYGTLEMATEVSRLVKSNRNKHASIFSMLGHEDGIIAYGRTASLAGQILLDTLVRSFE